MTEHKLFPDEREINEIIDAVSKLPGTAFSLTLKQLLVKVAYAAGAGAELEACCFHVEAQVYREVADTLRRVRQPKALTKQQELKSALRDLKVSVSTATVTGGVLQPWHPTIQKLEQLIEDLPSG